MWVARDAKKRREQVADVILRWCAAAAGDQVVTCVTFLPGE